ncbi:folylpolyglutamate synthase [Vermiconidia calcicola]|uniref:Folylpolyglutamate synthase n=1 Tax=Vermiconidia calcicola TaxID=1690605 RepID=A0ACC3N4N1_9PEZI|nr:folylpolyglutamate synthase [Vermiconidia calcicola]
MIELGLQRISRLLAKNAFPWRAIHVAGTNGKGSICAYISAMLEASNNSEWRLRHGRKGSPLKHARFTSPHLVDRWDCISINQQVVPFSSFDKVEKDVLTRNEKEGIGASEFEVLTATAFELFAQEQVDVAVVEVGMGGRLDATNVIGQSEGLNMPDGYDIETFRPAPLVTPISSIGLDHQAFLGNTLEDITREKAGIIKPGVPVVYDDSNPSQVTDVLQAVASERGSPIVDRNRLPRLSKPKITSIVSRLNSIPSQHTKQNATVAFLAAWTALLHPQLIGTDLTNGDGEGMLPEHFLGDLADDMLDVISITTFPGRQQMLSIESLTGRRADILLDGAHNAQSANALASAVSLLRKESTEDKDQKSITWVLAASDTKDAKEILSPLLKDGDAIFAVEFGPVDGMPWVRPLPASQLLEAAKAVVCSPGSLTVQDCGRDVAGALRAACINSSGGQMVVAGSLYLVGDVLRLLRGAR